MSWSVEAIPVQLPWEMQHGVEREEVSGDSETGLNW